MTEACPHKDAAASLIWWLTNDDSQKIEAANGSLPTRTAVWDWDIAAGRKQSLQEGSADGVPGIGEDAFPVPPSAEWIEMSNAVYPELQAAILGDKTSKQALDTAADKATKVLQDAGKL